MRVRENDIELRKSINDITIKYRADLEPLFFRHAGQVNYNIVKDEIRDLWKTFFSSGEETPLQDGEFLSASGARWVETGIRMFYFLTVIAVGAMGFGSVRKLIKK